VEKAESQDDFLLSTKNRAEFTRRTNGARPDPALKVTIVNCTPDDNKGASAITWGLVNRLAGSGVVGDVTLVSKTQSTSESDYRHTREKFGEDVRLLPSPLPSRQRKRGEYSLRNAAPLLGSTIGIHLRSYRRSLARRERAAEAISTSDVVFNRGGPFFSVRSGLLHVGLRLSWPLLLARREGVPYALVGEGIGPFANRWAKEFHRWLFEGAALIAVREELSRERLREIGVPGARIKTMLDNAFWVEPTMSSRLEEILQTLRLEEGRFLAVTVRSWPGAESRYLPGLAKTIDTLVPAFIDQAVLVTNTYNPGKPQSDDRGLTRRLQQLLGHNQRVHFVDEDLTPEELASFYGLSSVTFGTRLHSVILALVGGAPVVAVSYRPKTNGVMSGLKLDEFVLDINDYQHERGAELVRRAVTEQGHIPDLLARLRRQSDEELECFLVSLGGK
jgi:polysaccharide pyruvyl transferase WcaK-like protein